MLSGETAKEGVKVAGNNGPGYYCNKSTLTHQRFGGLNGEDDIGQPAEREEYGKTDAQSPIPVPDCPCS
jgi:hypothetical protein